jgi:hypothetical protein
MNKALALYAAMLKACLSGSDNETPEMLNQKRFTVRALFIAAVLFRQQQPRASASGLVAATDLWLKTEFGNINRFSGIIACADSRLIQIIDNHFGSCETITDIDIASLYENLLGIETGEEQQQNKLIAVKHYRNKLGSYYTPTELARQVTKNTISHYLEANRPNDAEISQLTFADFSCGAGNFLLEIIRYFTARSDKNGLSVEEKAALLQKIVRNIYAIDVDCIALEVAKLSLLLETGQPEAYTTINGHFYHANFLLQTNLPVEEGKKLELFAKGFIYHGGLALDKSKLSCYDIILGNPPWEKIRFENKKLADGAVPADFKPQLELAKKTLKNDAFFALSNGGELNTYALFTDAAAQLKKPNGVAGLILKSGLVTSQVNQKLFRYLAKGRHIIAVYDFINRRKIFNIDSRERFCFLLLGRPKKENFIVAMNLNAPGDIGLTTQMVELNYEDLESLNPLSGMLPNFTNPAEAAFLLRLARGLPAFGAAHEVKFGRIVHLNTHIKDITKKPGMDSLPIYEGKFFNQFDGKFAGFNGMSENKKYGNKSAAGLLNNNIPESRFFIGREKWLELSKNHRQPFMLAWRSLTSATNTRTCVATVLPFMPAIQSVQFLTTAPENILYLCGLFNSVVFDYVLKKKLSGIDLTQSVVNQMPVPDKEDVLPLKALIDQLVYSLLCDDERLQPLFHQLSLKKPISANRSELIRKLDLQFMLLYRLSGEEVKLVVSTFPKQYDDTDISWFLANLANDAVCASTAMASACPII